MTFWMLFRNAFRNSKALPETYQRLIDKKTSHTYVHLCTKYDKIVGFCWPSSWKTLVRSPSLCSHRATANPEPRMTCHKYDQS